VQFGGADEDFVVAAGADNLETEGIFYRLASGWLE